MLASDGTGVATARGEIVGAGGSGLATSLAGARWGLEVASGSRGAEAEVEVLG